MNRDRVVGADWLATTRFDLAAALPPGATRQQVPEMMQALLVERFHLRIHRETRESSGFALRTGPGEAKLEPAMPEPDTADQPITTTLQGSGGGILVRMPGGATYSLEKDRFDARKVTMAMFADLLTLFTGRPVVDETGLTGHFHLSFEIPRTRILTVRYGASVGVPVPPDALQFANDVVPDVVAVSLRRAGFSLESRRLSLEVIVVDMIDRSPTEN